jgi:hypothetical protein
MKTFIQVALVVILVLGMHQAKVNGPTGLAVVPVSVAAGADLLTAHSSSPGVQLAACIGLKGCVQPNVGWNT